MSESAVRFWPLLVLGAFVLWFAKRTWRDAERTLESFRNRALLQFRNTRAEFPAHGLAFDGRVAEILEQREQKFMAAQVPSNYVLTIDARMPDGELYQFKSDSNGKPWVMCKSRGDAMPVHAKAMF